MLAVLALLVVASPLDADPGFQEAQRFYAQLDYEQAILRFEQIAVRPNLSKPEKATALLWLGLSYAGVADFTSAKGSLAGALDLDPQIALPDKVSPRVTKLFTELKAERASHPDATGPRNGTPAATPAHAPTSMGLLVGAGVTAAGALAIVCAVATGGLAAYNWSQATAPHQFQDTAQTAVNATNTDLVLTAILAPTGLVLGGVGATLIAMNGD